MITFDIEKYSWKAPAIVTSFFALFCLSGLSLPLHGDEAKTYLEQAAVHAIVGPNQHTLFNILSNTSMKILGEYEVVFRFPVFLAAIFSIFLIHRLGQSLWNSTAATIASLLMVGSHHHFHWAQSGRGYALTELMAIAYVFGAILLLEGKSNKKGALVLILSGFALCLTQPSNAYFLPGCGLAFLFVLWESRNSEIPFSWPLLGKKLLPFFFLMVLTAGYFFMIYDDLVLGIETYKGFVKQFKNVDSLVVTPQQIRKIVWDLARPWSLWFYLPVLYGAWTLNRSQRSFFLILLGTPALLVVLSGMMGPPRVYVYALPFFILLAGLGIDRGIRSLSLVMPRYLNKALFATLGLAFLIPSVLSYTHYFLGKSNIAYATMAESREAFRYVQNQTTEHDLVVISFDDMALRRSLEPLVAEKMLRIFKDGQLDGITFLGHRDIPINHITSIAGSLSSALPVSLMRVVENIGNLRIYRMNVKVTPLIPLKMDTIFSQQWKKSSNPKFSGTETNAHRFLGQQSWQIKKNYKKNALIISPLVYNLPSQNGSFIFYAYAEKYQQKSQAGIISNKQNQRAFPLNYLFGVYREEGKNLTWKWIHPYYMFLHSKHKEFFKWRLTFMLIPLDARSNKIRQAFLLKDETSYFDGMHGHLLAPIVEK